MNITDHGELDYLTPNPSEVDQAIARAIRAQLHAPAQRMPDTVTQQLVRNGLSPSSNPFEWLRS